MKKRWNEGLTISVSSDADDIFDRMEGSRHYAQLREAGLGSFPFTRQDIRLLSKGNPLKQEYHFIEQGASFAFCTLYENRMDLLTFGKTGWFMKIKTIAYPCSLSCSGFLTNDTEMMLRYIKSLPGGVLVLNLEKAEKIKGMACGETLPACVLRIGKEYSSPEAFLAEFRSSYRRRLQLAARRCEKLQVKLTEEGSAEVYPLYLQTYGRSEYKLECLEESYFCETEGTRILFYGKNALLGFVLLRLCADRLVFLLCGMDYQNAEVAAADLYYYMLWHIVSFAIEKHCSSIDFGQTSEKTKLKFGAVLEKRYFIAHHSNPFLNLVALLGKHILEYQYAFPEFHVFKEKE